MIPAMDESPHAFDEAARQGLYRAIFSRRDVRAQFKPDPVPDEVLARLLRAAHHAPSVGYMQPWSFLLIRDRGVRSRVKALFDRANAEARAMFEDEQGAAYARLKLEGILDSPLNLCITCDPERAGKVVIGRTHIPEMDEYSTVCAVMNLWLAARAEGLGVGWVSILDPQALKTVLGIPERVIPVAYLCLGSVTHFLDKPELETAGWRHRLALDGLVHLDRWGAEGPDDLLPLLRGEIRHQTSSS
ncbi:MAG: 5,6-dimethylbenzimidazole synthase [Alphaproteobacteria bacterium]|jgi:5,6-dimethylbenzimidazole synthase|nr:5,6-dimethylbenzimidazole synthase [Alphaproteobacteria bacterium]